MRRNKIYYINLSQSHQKIWQHTQHCHSLVRTYIRRVQLQSNQNLIDLTIFKSTIMLYSCVWPTCFPKKIRKLLWVTSVIWSITPTRRTYRTHAYNNQEKLADGMWAKIILLELTFFVVPKYQKAQANIFNQRHPSSSCHWLIYFAFKTIK